MRRLAALVLLAVLATTAGCSSILGPSPPDAASLAENESYAWNASTDAYLELHRNNYTAVYSVSNRTTGTMGENATIELYTRDALGTEQPMSVSAVQFRYPNGTRVRFVAEDGEARAVRVYPNGSTEEATGALAVEKTRRRTVVSLPANDTGRIAFTTEKTGKQVATPTFVDGAYEMVLPPRGQVGVPVLAQVRPRETRTEVVNGRVHIFWENVRSRSISVRYYLHRDLLIFGSLVAGLSVAGLVGALYYLREIRKTRKRREEVDLDVDVPEDERRPPPGMG